MKSKPLGDLSMHSRAVMTLIFCALLWSSAGIATRHLQAANGFEVTFWRSLFCVFFMLGQYWLLTKKGFWGPVSTIRQGGWMAFLSGVMWCGMFTCFMMAMSLTTVANTLITMAIAPLLASVLAWLVLRERITLLTWCAIAAAGFGMFWMLRENLSTTQIDSKSALGMMVAMGVPICAALNLVLMKLGSPPRRAQPVDFSSAVLTGALLSCLITLPMSLPFKATGHDIIILALLGFFQLGLPCLIMIYASRHLAAQETSLLALLEVIFGPLWVWLFANEAPTTATLQGGGIILLALICNELFFKAKTAPPASLSSPASQTR